MKWSKRKSDVSPNSYWDTISDVMSTLLLVLLLVIVLLILYVVRAPDYRNPKSIPESEIVTDGVEEQYVERDAGHTVVKTDVPYLFPSEVEEEYGRGEESDDYLYEDGGFREGEFDGHAGAAVRVIVEDAETGNAIQEEDISFNLYSSEGRGIRLHSFYPSHVVWTRFATDKSGSFYLPEKLILASYMLHEETVPSGYEPTEDIIFSLEEPSTWDAPFIVHVALNSIRRAVRISSVDSVSGEPVPGGVFDIVAAEDIKTKDGTLRYSEGNMVDQVSCNKLGEGQSIPLYLGNYIVRQSVAPDYYAVGEEIFEINLDNTNNNSEPISLSVTCEKTRYTLNVVDELYQDMAIADAEFILCRDTDPETVRLATDNRGIISLDALNKQTTYSLTQSSTSEGYQTSEKALSFYVDENGRISEQSSKEETVTNRTLRLSTLVQDALFKNAVSGCRAELYNEKNQIVNAWYTADMDTVIQGLPAGQYRLCVSGNGDVTVPIQLEDTAQIQTIQASVWTNGNKLMVGSSTTAIGAIIAGILVNRRRRKRKQGAK